VLPSAQRRLSLYGDAKEGEIKIWPISTPKAEIIFQFQGSRDRCYRRDDGCDHSQLLSIFTYSRRLVREPKDIKAAHTLIQSFTPYPLNHIAYHEILGSCCLFERWYPRCSGAGLVLLLLSCLLRLLRRLLRLLGRFLRLFCRFLVFLERISILQC